MHQCHSTSHRDAQSPWSPRRSLLLNYGHKIVFSWVQIILCSQGIHLREQVTHLVHRSYLVGHFEKLVSFAHKFTFWSLKLISHVKKTIIFPKSSLSCASKRFFLNKFPFLWKTLLIKHTSEHLVQWLVSAWLPFSNEFFFFILCTNVICCWCNQDTFSALKLKYFTRQRVVSMSKLSWACNFFSCSKQVHFFCCILCP